jgi:hypothetical protein
MKNAEPGNDELAHGLFIIFLKPLNLSAWSDGAEVNYYQTV